MSTDVGSRRAELVEQRAFLLSSIRDLERELAAGDISEEDYTSLREDYVERAAHCLREIEELGEARPAGPQLSRWRRFRRYLGRRGVRRVLAVGVVLCLLAASGTFAAHLAGVRLPGQSATGSITMTEAATVTEELEEASIEANAGQIAAAVLLYSSVLQKVPEQPQALTYHGWADARLAGLKAHSTRTITSADAEIKKAASLDPSYADPQGLLGVVELEDDDDAKAAVVDFNKMLADKPSTTILAAVRSAAVKAYADLGESLPASLRS